MKYENKRAEKMIEREIKIMEKLQHDNIIQIVEFEKEAKRFKVALTLCTGSVKSMLKRGVYFADEKFPELVKNMTSAMEYLYEHRIFHRDIKPDNILHIDERKFLLADFGLATEYERYDQEFYEVCGTLDYFHPKILASIVEGNGAYTIESDIYSLGVSFFECITSQKPFWSKFRDTKLRAEQMLIQINSKYPGAIYWSSKGGYCRYLNDHHFKNEFNKKQAELLLIRMLITNPQMTWEQYFAAAKKIFE